MNIPDEHILLNPVASSKRALLTEMVDLLSAVDPDAVLELIMARERLGSTGIGHGVAIPHSRMPDLTQPVFALARHEQGVEFDAHDNQPVHIVLLLLVPEDDSGQDLRLLAHLARRLKEAPFREKIMQAKDKAELVALFQQENPVLA